MTKLTIAIDGFSGCGKSTIAKDLAKALNYVFIDSGAMYRGVTLYAMNKGLIDEHGFNKEALIKSLDKIHLSFERANSDSNEQCLILNGINVEDDIRSLRVAKFVSQIAAVSEVRKKLVELQRAMGKNGGIVMDGRDIGSVVFPNADLKFFVTADLEIRAQRRLAELKQKGEKYDLQDIIENLKTRDLLDTTRKDSPLVQTVDAILLDTSSHSRESQLAWVKKIAENRIAEIQKTNL
jgi:cytidylate kinase